MLNLVGQGHKQKWVGIRLAGATDARTRASLWKWLFKGALIRNDPGKISAETAAKETLVIINFD